ncbi:calcium-binding protein [Bradyrhizobium retamae]|uniref:RTX toxin n=1 Tax=Bradyrhizobium retamae TaxID=1300035 RepID=A0A0R3MM33_9BRAD|nr:cadherin-like domain-containing protein [Bradyrhizobium retamae]KRR18480.1 RTX toxin [Bradyrhizobium retamae]
MITAKAFKPTSQSQQSQPTREDYVESEQQKKRIVPLAFLLFLTGCAAYLKSFLPIKIEAREAQQASKHDEGDQSDPRWDDEIGAATEEDVATNSAERSARSSGKVDPIRIVYDKDDNLAVGSPAIEPAPPFSLRVATGPIGDAVRASNDNRSSAPSGSGESGSGGGGGGGGHDRPPTPRNPDPPVITDPVRNRAPRTSGPVHLQDLVGCQVLMISVLALLTGTADPDGDRLTISNLSSTSGTLTPTEDGGWMFVRDGGMLGDVNLTYTISDGSASVLQTAYFSVVEAPPIIGTVGDDNLLGTNCGETIDGRAGDDNIDARGGDDVIIGEAGDDHIIAGPGNDVVYAGAGNDVVFAGAGNDIVFGGAGNDHLYGEDGDDTIMGEDGDDFMSGGSGKDILIAGAGDDTLQGGADNDTLDGGEGNDNVAGGTGNDVMTAAAGNDGLLGGDGNDVLSDGAGQDSVHGDAGDDHVVAAADAANDIYDGGAGRDTLDYSAATESVTADLGAGTAEGSETGHDVIGGFEVVIGGSGDDRISAGSTSVAMSGGAGNDALEGGAGNDSISDGAGCDTVSAGGGDDQVAAAADGANDSYDGGSGQDTLDYSTATFSVTVDVGRGKADGLDIGHDLIAAFEEVIAGSGNDHIVAGSTSLSMTGGDGNDTFEFHRSEDQHEMTVRKITDFTVGDRIVAATYEISYLQEDGIQEMMSDMFDAIYLSTNGDHRPVRFRFEEVDSNQLTLVDVHDRPDTDEFFTIELVGHHHLQFTVAVA